MTTAEILSGVETLSKAVLTVKQTTEKAGKNPSWALVAHGALQAALEQLAPHIQHVETPPAPPAVLK